MSTIQFIIRESTEAGRQITYHDSMKQWLQRRETNVNLYDRLEVRPSQVVGRFTVFWGGMPEPQLFLTSEDLVKQNFGLFVCRRNGFNFFVKKTSDSSALQYDPTTVVTEV